MPGDYDADLVLNAQGGNSVRAGNVRIAPGFSGIYAKYGMYFIPNCSMTLCQLHCAIVASAAIGVGFCICGSCINGVVEGIQWDCDAVVHILYRSMITCLYDCSCTLTPPQANACTYSMRGVLIAFD